MKKKSFKLPANHPTKLAAEKSVPEKLWEQLSCLPNTPGWVRGILSAEHVRRFMEIMTSRKAIEADWLMLCGYLTPDQVIQYQDVTGNAFECSQELMDLAVTIADEFRPKLATLVLNEMRGRKGEGINALFDAFVELLRSRSRPVEHLEIFSFFLAEEFMMRVMALIGSDLVAMMKSKEFNDAFKGEIRKCLDNGETFFQNVMGIQFVGFQFHNEKSMYLRTIAKYSCYLDATIGFVLDRNDERRILRENEEHLYRIREEILYKSISVVTLSKQLPQIIVIKDDPKSDFKCISHCSVRINFNEETIGFPALKEDVRGHAYYDYGIKLGVINLKLNSETGDLCFITGGIPFSQFIPRERYLALQNYVLRNIREYLEGKEPDVEDLFVYSEAELAVRKAASLVKTESESQEHSSDMLSHQSVEYVDRISGSEEGTRWWKYRPFRKKKVPIEQPVKEEAEVVLPKHLRTVIMKRISGASAEEILSALRRMLGKEEKTEGSHLFFHSDRTNLCLPVPRHSQKDKHHISLRLILSNLNKWGYSPMELAAELGAEVPERIVDRLQESYM